ncbi:MAG: DUF7674 family protein [Planctomycetota bacterium]
MITKQQMLPMLVDACPSFARAWADLELRGEADRAYVCLSRFVEYLRELQRAGDVSAFPKVAQVVERFHLEGDNFVKEAATVGFLESLDDERGDALFISLLGSESRKWLSEVEAFWRGERHYIGEVLERPLSEEDLQRIRDDVRRFNETLGRKRRSAAS